MTIRLGKVLRVVDLGRNTSKEYRVIMDGNDKVLVVSNEYCFNWAARKRILGRVSTVDTAS